MDRQPEALRAAIDLYLMPSRVRAMQAAPLPKGVERLLAIAAGEAEALAAAVRESGRSDVEVREAAGFFIEHVLLSSEANSYRLLGSERRASSNDLRRNMVLLMRWLHPDKQTERIRTSVVQRVTKAWEDLKSPERREKYDAALDQAERKKSDRSNHRRSRANGERSKRSRSSGSEKGLWAMVVAFLGGARK